MALDRPAPAHPRPGETRPVDSVAKQGMAPLCVERIGHGKEQITFLHGLGGRGGQFAAAARFFAADRYTLNLVDLPGFGGSPKPADFSYEIQEMADWVKAYLSRITTQPQHLVAHSMGGIVALQLAAQTGLSCASLTLAEGILVEPDAVMSERIARHSEGDFVRRYPRWLRRLSSFIDESSTSERREIAASFAAASPIAMHRAAKSCVAWSRSGALVSQFAALACPRAQFVGQNSRQAGRVPVEPSEGGICRYVVANQGHFLMAGGATFYEPLAQFIAARDRVSS